jgi:hypothetical protein
LFVDIFIGFVVDFRPWEDVYAAHMHEKERLDKSDLKTGEKRGFIGRR